MPDAVTAPPALATFAGMALVSAADVAATTSVRDAVDALEAALRGGLDPEQDAPRTRLTTAGGELLIMPSTLGAFAGVKLLSSTPGNPARGRPVIQGAYLLFEGEDQRPAAVVDGIALTNLRTPATSALAVRHLSPATATGPARLTVFGTGPQAGAHVVAMTAVREIAEVTLVGRHPRRVADLAAEVAAAGLPVRTAAPGDPDAVAHADIVCCCTSATAPLFDGALVKDDAVVVAIGSHFPDARETDDALVTRAAVVVESRASTLREAGDIVLPVAAGVLGVDRLITLADVVTGRASLPDRGPRLFKGTGMPWQDLVVAAEIFRRTRR
jgi:ornithine cyclodeaminase/alanine dehydrogenase-like protein (mu-crystallin family)